MREKFAVFRVILIVVSRTISRDTVQKTVQFHGVFSTEWMETISACKVLMVVVCGVAWLFLHDLAWCCPVVTAMFLQLAYGYG